MSNAEIKNIAPRAAKAARRQAEVLENWRQSGADISDTEELGALIQKEVRQLFRHSISRRPTVWPQVIVVNPAAPAALDV